MSKRSFLGRLESVGKAAEDAVLVIILTSLIVLAAGQIVLRNFFDVGFIWTDELLRLLVLWLAVAGAVAASRKDRHISIAVLDRFLPDSLQKFLRWILDLFTAVVCGLICWYSIAFVRTTHEYGDTMLGDFPAWILQLILPVGFGLITWRYTVFAARGLFGNRLPEETE